MLLHLLSFSLSGNVHIIHLLKLVFCMSDADSLRYSLKNVEALKENQQYCQRHESRTYFACIECLQIEESTDIAGLAILVDFVSFFKKNKFAFKFKFFLIALMIFMKMHDISTKCTINTLQTAVKAAQRRLLLYHN